MNSGLAARRAFTLVETVLALGIAMLFLAAIFTLLTVGLTTSREATDDTTIGLVLRETSTQLRGHALAAAPSTPTIFYFDNRGRQVYQTPEDAVNNYYCAVATVVAPATMPPDTNLLAVVVKIYSQIAPVPYAPAPTTAPKAIFSLQVTSTSGKGWKQLDPTYQPKIDL